jgi:hypothetical protein
MPRFNINQLAGWEPPVERGDLSRCETSGKEMHPTERAAEATAAWREKQSGTPIGTYYCLWCGAWHLTSSQR